MNSRFFRKTVLVILAAFSAVQITAQTDSIFQPAHVITLDSVYVLLQDQIIIARYGTRTDTILEPFGNHSYLQKITRYNKYNRPINREVYIVYSHWDLPQDEAFDLGLEPVQKEYSRKWYYTEYYEYQSDTMLIEIHQTASDHYYNKTRTDQSAPRKRGFVSAEKPIYSFVGRIGEMQPSYLYLKNSDTATYILSPQTNSHRLTELADFVLVEPLAPAFYSVSLPYDEDEHYDTLFLVNDSVKISFVIYSFGYHVCSDDIKAENKVRVTDHFIYYRKGNEALLRIYSESGDSLLATFSLAQLKTEVNLETLRTGKYLIETVDFHTGLTSRCLLIIS